MKYKVGIRKKRDPYSVMEKNLLLMTPISPTRATEEIIAKPSFSGIESFSDLPLALKKPYFLSNFTSCICLTVNGTPKIAIHKKINPSNLSPLKYSLIAKHKVIPNQNIIFQKLSLFNRDLTKLIISPMHILKYQNISHIISIFKGRCKLIRLSVAILMIAVASIQSCFADNVAELINKTEQEYGIPSGLLKSIATVESGNKPYALNISGRSIFAGSKEEAVKIVRGLQDQGITNIDLGLAQINLYWHGEHFKSIEEMLEPKHNIEYAAKFLNALYRQHGSWNKAVRYYHSANPQHHIKYSRKVLISWLGS